MENLPFMCHSVALRDYTAKQGEIFDFFPLFLQNNEHRVSLIKCKSDCSTPIPPHATFKMQTIALKEQHLH